MATTDAQLVHHWLRLKNTDRIPSKNALTRKIKNLKIWDWRWMKWGQGWHRGKKAQKPGNLDFYNTIFDKDGMPLFEEVDRAKLKALQNYYRRHPDRIPPVDEHALVTTNNPLVKIQNTRRNKLPVIYENNNSSEAETAVNSVAESLHNGLSSNSNASEISVVSTRSGPLNRMRHVKVHNFMPEAKARQSKVHDFLPRVEDGQVVSIVNPMIRARQSKVHNFVPGTKKSERTGGRRTRRA
jgi:hypothetical protein